MKKSRDVVGLPVIELSEGKSLGKVQGLVFNPTTRRIEALEVGERSFLKTITELIPYTKIRSIGLDAVTVTKPNAETSEEVSPELEQLAECKLVGMQAVTAGGMLAGTVSDFYFTPADGTLSELILQAEKSRMPVAVPVMAVESFGRDFIIVSDTYTAQARPTEDGAEFSPQQLVRTLEMKAVDFAMGREAGQDVADDQGSFIIRKGEQVTQETIAKAREKNRLIQVLLAAGAGELLEGVDFTREKLDVGSKKLMEAWQMLRGRSQEWLARRLEDDKPSPTGELRELWYQLQGKLVQGGRELEGATKEKIRYYVVGKILAQPVYDKDGALIGARGDIVSEEMRNTAEAAGRLPQLFMSAASGDVSQALEPIKKQIKDVLGE